MWPGVWSSIGAWHVGVVIMVPETISKKLRPMEFLLLHGLPNSRRSRADFGCLQVTLANSPHPSTGIIVPSEVLKLLRLAIYSR